MQRQSDELRPKKTMDQIRALSMEQWIVVVLAGVLIFMLCVPKTDEEKSNLNKGSAKETTEAETLQNVSTDETYLRKWEEKLSILLSEMEGVGKVRVVLNLSSSMEEIKVENEEASLFFQKDQETSYVVKTIAPKLSGAVILCQGAGNRQVEERITEAVCALMNLSAEQIKVLPMRKL